MFKIYLLDTNNFPTKIYDDSDLVTSNITEPELELNGESGILIGKLTFKLLDRSNLEELQLLEKTAIVTQMISGIETVIFRGRPFLRDEDDYNDQDYTFEGILAGLNDTVQPPSTEYLVGWSNHFKTIIDWHNETIAEAPHNRTIDHSKISSDDESSYMYNIVHQDASLPDLIHRFTTEYTRVRASTMDHLKSQYVESYGGYFFIENEPYELDSGGQVVLHNYLKYVDIYSSDQAHVNTQTIELGKNLISVKRSANAEDFATVLIPLGAQLTDVEKSWSYYKSAANWKIIKTTDSPDNAETINYANSGAVIDAESGKIKTGFSTNYRVLYDVEVSPGDVYFLTTYLEGVSTDYSIAAYAIISRDGTTLVRAGTSVRNSKDSNNNVEVKNISLKDERIEIPTDVDIPSGMKLRLARYATDSSNSVGFVLEKFNKNYKETNVTIMTANEQTTGDIRKIGKFGVGRDVYPDATSSETAPETYEQSKRLINYPLFQSFGPIEKTIEFSNYNSASVNNLRTKASRELEKMGENIEIEVQAADLSYIDESQEPFNVYDLVPVKSEPHGMDLLLPIVKMTLPLSDPASATYTLQNDIHLSQENKKYISQMVSSSGISSRPTTTVYISGGGSDSGGGGGSGDVTNAVLYTFQTLTESQKSQARSNIGAVAAIAGKGLSSNDYTTDEKNKLSGIESGAEKNVQSDWNQTDTTADDYIKNKPSIPTKTSDLENDSGFITEFDAGILSVNGHSGPTVTLVTSDLLNDSGYITIDEVPQEVPVPSASENGMVLGVENGQYVFTRMTGGISDVYMDGASIVQSGTTIAVIPKANTTRFGVVKLYDGSDSTSKDLAPTADALRSVSQRVGQIETASQNWRTETQIKALIAEAFSDYQDELAALDRYANVVVAQSRDDIINLLFVSSASTVFSTNPYKYGYVIYNTKTISGGGSSADIYEFPRGYIICVYRGDGYEVTISGVTYYFQYAFLKYPTLEPLAAYNEEDVEFYSGTVVSGTALEQAQQDAKDFIAYIESQP